MTLTQLIDILMARIKLIIFCAFVATVSAIAIALLLPKKFKATNSIIFNHKITDPISGAAIPPQLLPGYMATEVDIITSNPVIAKAVGVLELDKDPELLEAFNAKTDTNGDGVGDADFNNWMVESLLKKIDVAPSRRSNLILITAKDETAEGAAQIANAVSSAYLKKSVEMKVAPSRTAANFYTTQLAELEKKYEEANEKFIQYQRKNNIQTVRERDVDVETERLNRLSDQLVAVQAQAAEGRSRQHATRRGSSPDVVADALVQSLKSDLASAQANFSAVSSQYASNHPEYISAKSKVNQARASLNRQMGAVSRSVSSSANIYARNAAEIKAALEKQRKVVLNLNTHRNELSLLERDVENAQKAYDAANERFIQSNFEGESNQSNVTLLSAAIPPRLPASPNKKLIVLIGAFLGLFLSAAYVLFSELLDRKVRSVEDLESVLDVPSFGVLPKTKLKLLNPEQVKALSFKG